MSAEDPVMRALREIDRILRSYDIQDSFLRELISWREHEPERFSQEVRSNDLWGGAGSISDISLRSMRPERERAPGDERLLDAALADLAEALDAEGMATEEIRARGALFRRSAERTR
jgi:hypothetical protein